LAFNLYRLNFYKINVQVISRYLFKNKISLHPYDCTLNVFTLFVAVLAFPLCPKLKQLLVL
jgi:hypothetical protein